MFGPFEDISVITTSQKDQLLGLAFPVVSSIGGYFSKSEGFNTILAGIKQLILTRKGERVMLPEYGTNLRAFIFEQDTPTLRKRITDEIAEAIFVYEPRVTIKNLEVYINESHGQNTIMVALQLSLTNDFLQTRILEIIV
tara:strand:- start:1416 stop:1835 length:420 start_codon:yes stop_codon:yes gene_type:complete